MSLIIDNVTPREFKTVVLLCIPLSIAIVGINLMIYFETISEGVYATLTGVFLTGTLAIVSKIIKIDKKEQKEE